MNQYTRLMIALIVLLGIAGTFILYLSLPFLTGKAIVLATRPVDPFDLLRGQYMTINYEISNIPAVEGAKESDRIYVLLNPDNQGIWRYKEAALVKPNDGTFIKGIVKSVYGNNMWLEYGIEQFFFERNAKLPTRNITVEAKVDSSGQARIVNLLHNGKPIEIEYKKPSITS
jgi:uncharacterized membrane-anchored protein